MTGRRWAPAPQRTGFLDASSGHGRADNGATFAVPPAVFGEGCVARGPAVLLDALPAGAQRVYLLNVPAHWWGLSAQLAPGGAWTVSKRGHHASDATPVLRFHHALQERDVELRDASEWFGPVVSADVARDSWELLRARLSRLDAPLLAGPSTTGRQMLDRSGTLSEPVENTVADTCRLGVQAGRVELRAPASDKARVRSLAHVDARVSYGALAKRSLGVGPVVHDDNPAPPPCVCKTGAHNAAPWSCPGIRARVLVRAEVPAGWAHVGLLGVAGKPARYPDAPGEVFDTWADAAEVALAVQHGWSVDVHERVIFTPGKPLDSWAGQLERVWTALTVDALPDVQPEVLAAVRWAVRAIVLKTIGALAQTSYRRTRVYASDDQVPDGIGADFHASPGGGIVTTETVPLGRAGYPELTAQLWARGRVRLLDAPTGTAGVRAGALHVPARQVVAMNTDALYLDGDPGWPDDGAWGRYRLKGRLTKARTWPTKPAQLHKLRDEAERELTSTVRRAEVTT